MRPPIICDQCNAVLDTSGQYIQQHGATCAVCSHVWDWNVHQTAEDMARARVGPMVWHFPRAHNGVEADAAEDFIRRLL